VEPGPDQSFQAVRIDPAIGGLKRTGIEHHRRRDVHVCIGLLENEKRIVERSQPLV
jgi:hypothetical protein